LARRSRQAPHQEPMSVYEVHLGSWRPGLGYRVRRVIGHPPYPGPQARSRLVRPLASITEAAVLAMLVWAALPAPPRPGGTSWVSRRRFDTHDVPLTAGAGQ
ncbi:hypothetical protein ABZX66_19605, partial [Micromonospora aurantiaca]|uniref:hypothetical protein n=1 Tax=Micromonospora aurantiaca (nom. illeg.) TaxID=47850 RepID=UPI0033A543E5